MKFKIPLLIATIVVCLTGVAFGGVFVESSKTPESAEAVAAYWTPARMQNAIPYPMGIGGSPRKVDSAALEAAAGTKSGFAPSSANGRRSILLYREKDTVPASEIAPASASYPFPHTTYRIGITVYNRFPYRANGKVFFTKATGGNYVCSGSSIGGRAVLTAGHCVSDGYSRWHKNWTFVPAYKAGSRPYGTWYKQYSATFSAWHNQHKWCRDVGITVTRWKSGKKLSQRVGYLGYAYNQTRNKQHYDAFGYPSASPWDGRYQVQTSAEWARNVNPGCWPYPVGIGTYQRPGSSGGPWLIRFYPNLYGSKNLANGVFSFYYTSQPNAIYSPYFDTTVRNFIATYRAK